MRADDILTLARTYGQALDLALSTVGKRACGNVYVFNRIAEGRGCHSNTLERASEWFAGNWPDDVPWPEDVPRPARAPSQAA